MSNAQFLIQEAQTPELVNAFRVFKKEYQLETDSVENHLLKMKEIMDSKGWVGLEKECAEFYNRRCF